MPEGLCESYDPPTEPENIKEAIKLESVKPKDV